MSRSDASRFSGLADLAFPDVCPICQFHAPDGKSRACPECMRGLISFGLPRCNACGGGIDGILDICTECLQTPRTWEHAATVFEFGGAVRELIHRFKYGGDVMLAPLLAQSSYDHWLHVKNYQPDILVPVPLHWFKELRRGYNQSELLAREFSRLSGIPLCNWLRRTLWTSPQARLDLKERRRNLKNAFQVRPGKPVAGKSVLLLDDVLTTGTTLEACTMALKHAGAARVQVITIARG